MNERIRELADQCYYLNACNLPLFNKKKFAKLIIKECAHIAWLNSTQDNISHIKIKDHFGVE